MNQLLSQMLTNFSEYFKKKIQVVPFMYIVGTYLCMFITPVSLSFVIGIIRPDLTILQRLFFRPLYQIIRSTQLFHYTSFFFIVHNSFGRQNIVALYNFSSKQNLVFVNNINKCRKKT